MRDGQEGSLRIIQYNAWKSANKVMIEFMTQERVRSADILAIQEPWRNPRDGTGYNPSGGPFKLIDAGTANTRVSIYLTRRFGDEDIEVITVEPDLITLAIHSRGEGDRDRVLLYIVYNPPSESHSIREASA